MAKKLNIGLIFGGNSPEHDISILSAKKLSTHLDLDFYQLQLIYVCPKGAWYLIPSVLSLKSNYQKYLIIISPHYHGHVFLRSLDYSPINKIDVAFPIIHGNFGEDGRLQGFLDYLNIPYVGCGLSSAHLCYDKTLTKRILKEAGMKVVPYLTIDKLQSNIPNFEQIKKQLGLPLIVKPAQSGSSFGLSLVKHKTDWITALEAAFLMGEVVLIESFIKGREIECGVLGNEVCQTSLPGELLKGHEIYCTDEKYHHESSVKLDIPAKLPDHIIQQIQSMCIKAYQALRCKGMARVDFFLSNDNELYINEINTHPGFTSTSMYPKLMEHKGLPLKLLITQLIELALKKHY